MSALGKMFGKGERPFIPLLGLAGWYHPWGAQAVRNQMLRGGGRIKSHVDELNGPQRFRAVPSHASLGGTVPLRVWAWRGCSIVYGLGGSYYCFLVLGGPFHFMSGRGCVPCLRACGGVCTTTPCWAGGKGDCDNLWVTGEEDPTKLRGWAVPLCTEWGCTISSWLKGECTIWGEGRCPGCIISCFGGCTISSYLWVTWTVPFFVGRMGCCTTLLGLGQAIP